ncbi:MAG TPA: hypothetical protein DFR83_20750 [Deltaproteobacteria bacterium]|nr:hypothetical protein [Deltaproteobacteria bacterium]
MSGLVGAHVDLNGLHTVLKQVLQQGGFEITGKAGDADCAMLRRSKQGFARKSTVEKRHLNRLLGVHPSLRLVVADQGPDQIH